MKTLKTLLMTMTLAAFTLIALAADYNESRYEFNPKNDLKTTIKKMVANDFSSINNYFIRNGIETLNEDVKVKFFIDKENKMHIVEVEGNDENARTYIKQLLDGKKVKASDMLLNKYYLLGIKIDYRS
jgi:hypothetical protein